jgi:2-phospho-L-lactate/phosphoenolpyruvate guanylyltransferase
MRTAAVLPVKRFTQAKQRLRVSIAESVRQELVTAMVSDVLSAIAEVEAIDLTVLVTCEQAAIAAADDGTLIVQDAEQGQSAAVQLGIEAALADGAERVLCIPGDCPALDPLEIAALLGEQREREAEVLVIPDRHGTGTNGLLLRPPRAIAPSFGPDSCARHLTLAHEAGVRCRIASPSSLLLDVDTGEDLQALRGRLQHERVWAPRTRAVLSRIGEQAWEASHSAA